MNAGTFFGSPISSIMRSTASFAPPCSGPYSAAMPAATAENGSTCEEPTERTAFVEQFCSWSACRMNSTSRALTSRSSASNFLSMLFKMSEQKFEADERGHLRDHPDHLHVPVVGVVDVP